MKKLIIVLIIALTICDTMWILDSSNLRIEISELNQTIELQQQIILNYKITDAQQKELIETLNYINEDVKADIEQIKSDLKGVSEWLGKDE